jgi:glycosyltransferase involved in cell wall biosynthesis
MLLDRTAAAPSDRPDTRRTGHHAAAAPPMRIALLSFEYPPETGFGGIGTYAWYQARALAKLGHEVHVLAGATDVTPLRSSAHDGLTVYRFRAGGGWMRQLKRLDKHRLWWTKNRLENGWCMHLGLKELRRRFEYDVVEMPECGAEGLLINWLQRAKTVIKFHSPAELIMSTYDVRKADHRACSFVEKWAIRGAGAFTSCSRFLADEVRTKMGVRRPIDVIYNGIDLELFDHERQIDAREKFGLPRGKPVIFFAGRMEKRKGIHLCPEIVETILRKHDVAFAFAGSDLFGVMEKEMLPRLRAQELKGSVHYLGKLTLQEVGSCLRQSDIYFIPSLWENCPYSCLEAMAAGRAIVASDAGGLPELIQDGSNGLIAKSGVATEFVRQLERLIEDTALRERLGAEARRSVEQRYTDVGIARQSVDSWTKALALGAA